MHLYIFEGHFIYFIAFFFILKYFLPSFALKKGYLSSSMVSWRTFNIHGTFALHNKFFIVGKRFFRFLKCAHIMKKKWFCSQKGSLGTQNGSSIASLHS